MLYLTFAFLSQEIDVAESSEAKPDGATSTSLNLQEEFNAVLDDAISKLWDERLRNKSKGKRKRLSKDEEKTLSMYTKNGILYCTVCNCTSFLEIL
jgi:hypothetical protein